MFGKGKCFINFISPSICHLSIIIYVYLSVLTWQVCPFPNILGRKSVGKRQRRLGHVHKTSF